MTKMNKMVKNNFNKFKKQEWRCDKREHDAVAFNHIYNVITDEYIDADYDGNILSVILTHTSLSEAKEIAKIQSCITRNEAKNE